MRRQGHPGLIDMNLTVNRKKEPKREWRSGASRSSEMKKMKLITAMAFAAGMLLGGVGGVGAQELRVNEIGVQSIEGNSKVDMFRPEKDQLAIPRNFDKQPPLIPHSIKGYNITQNFNKCMDCHSKERAAETGATKVAASHYLDRDGKQQANISPRRYFCMQCHVAQFDAKPLVVNSYKPAAKKGE
ncbi:MAG: nitrate reductase cytochrome c-type subunit [Proteobacteria bacterium]|nr:nitrate reductase cytochrome c-type subunit [Pseudomonadota bacterium]